jgi:hypothetical protein
MTPYLPDSAIAADTYEARIERQIMRAEELYDLDGETFFRNRGGRIETGNWEVES